MKNFLTKSEACNALKTLQDGKTINHSDSVALASIRICLVGEEMGLNLWGENVEEARPAFNICNKPEQDASELEKENYEVYKYCVAQVYEKFSSGGM